MANGYGNIRAGIFDGTVIPASHADGQRDNAKMRRHREIFDLSKATVARNVGDTNFICRRPKSTAFAGGKVTVSATLATSTISVGTLAVPAKYSALTAYTSIDTPVSFGKAAAVAEDPLTDYEDVYLTNAVAPLPAAGLIIIDFDTIAR